MHIVRQGGAFLKEKIKTFFAICILILTVPYVVTLLFQGNKTSVGRQALKSMLEEGSDSGRQAGKDGLDMEEYLTGILAKEIPLDYQMETIKAQAVIGRTSLAAALETEEKNLPASMSREEMLELWGQDGFEENYRILEEAVRATQGEILSYSGKPIQAEFHAVSAGRTRSAKEAFQREDEPYLDGVDSGMDIPSPDFLKVVFLDKEEFGKKLAEVCPSFHADTKGILDSVTVEERDSSGYVVRMKAGEEELSGEVFRSCFGLNSSCFYLKEVEGQVRIVTKGLGHGLGLSQYGANELAKEGKSYQEILKYYYQEISIEEISE